MRRAPAALLPALLALLAAAPPAGALSPRRLDPTLERPKAWTVHRPDRARVSVDRTAGAQGSPALLIEWQRDLGTVKDSIPSAPQVPSVWIPLPADADLSRYTTLRLRARLGGARHGFLHVALSNQPRLWGEGVTMHLANLPLDAGGWRDGVVSLDLAPIGDRRAMRWLGFATINVGHPPDEGASLRTWIDEVVLTAETPPKRSGWDCDPNLIAVSRLGFRPHHEKLAVAPAALAGQAFEVRRHDTDASAFRGVLTAVESAVGRQAVADFTRLTEPGEYHLRAGELVSLPFRIGGDAHEHSLNLLSDWVHAMRCGAATPLHPACHLDDGLRPPAEGATSRAPRSLPLSGGWHDAGDVRTYYSYSYEMAWRLLRARDAGRRRDRDGDGTDDLLDGARWALQHAVRLEDPATGRLFDKIDDSTDFRRGNYWTDNLRGTDDDRRVLVSEEQPREVAFLAASAGLALQRAESAADRKLAREAVELAERRVAAWVHRPPSPRPNLPPRPLTPKLEDPHGHRLAAFGLGALQLHLANGRRESLELALSCGDAVLALQAEHFQPGAVREMGGDLFPWVLATEDMDLPELFLAELLLAFPEDERAPRWRAALRRVADWWMKPSRELWAPWSLPTLVLPDKEVPEGATTVQLSEPFGRLGSRWLLPSAGRQQLSDTALALQRIAQALEDPELERLARRQLHWAFGYNPFGVSWVAHHDAASITQMYSFSQGSMPGAVAGYGIGANGVPRCHRPGGGEPVTHAAAELFAAAVAATQPAVFSLEIVDGGRPWRGEVEVIWERTGAVVASAATDSRGRLPELALDGGERYRLRIGNVELPLIAISGRRVERRLDRSRQLVLSAESGTPATASRPFTVALTVRNAGTERVAETIGAYAAGASLLQDKAEVELAPGESRTLDWPLRAKTAGRAWIVTFRATSLGAVLDATGPVREPEPPPTAR